MSATISLKFKSFNADHIAKLEGKTMVVLSSAGDMDAAGMKIDQLTQGALSYFAKSEGFKKLKSGEIVEFIAPLGMVSQSVLLLKLDFDVSINDLRKAGSNLAKSVGKEAVNLLILAENNFANILFGFTLRQYDFNNHKSKNIKDFGTVSIFCNDPKIAKEQYNHLDAIAQGVFFTRDLVNEPANVLTTEEFADRLEALGDLGVKVKILDDADMQRLGMNALLGVGMGSDSPSKIVVMEWNGGGDEAPLALVGKGVVFDSGGISLKPASGMEDMTMDMGGAGVVAGVMKTLALRGAKANVIGLVGLVENMPDARAQRPGDVVISMKGDTIEVINTDAEGRLVLADVLWYVQQTYKPCAIIDLATLTGAIIVGLGHENAGVFSNNDEFCNDFIAAANAENEGAWRMPMGDAYAKLIKSRIADIMNVGGRTAGSITAAQFLQHFIEPDMPWIHLDIAGVASVKTETDFSPKGATGWGVRSLNRLIVDKYEKSSN